MDTWTIVKKSIKPRKIGAEFARKRSKASHLDGEDGAAGGVEHGLDEAVVAAAQLLDLVQLVGAHVERALAAVEAHLAVVVQVHRRPRVRVRLGRLCQLRQAPRPSLAPLDRHGFFSNRQVMYNRNLNWKLCLFKVTVEVT